MLASGGPERVFEIAKRAGRLKGGERQRVLSQLGLLSGLRRLTGRLRMDERLEQATSPQLERWSKKMRTAETLEGALGKR